MVSINNDLAAYFIKQPQCDTTFLAKLNSAAAIMLGAGNMVFAISHLAEDDVFTACFGGWRFQKKGMRAMDAVKAAYGVDCEEHAIVVFIPPDLYRDLDTMTDADKSAHAAWHFVHWSLVNALANTCDPRASLTITLAAIYSVAALLPISAEQREKVIDTSLGNFFMTYLSEAPELKTMPAEDLLDFEELEPGAGSMLLSIQRGDLQAYELSRDQRGLHHLVEETHLLRQDILDLHVQEPSERDVG